MGKNKLAKFRENKTFDHVLEPALDEYLHKDFKIKGYWKNNVFKNNNPIILELGCGKGEYTVNLAREYPNKNFIGIDIKGARIWRGAKNSAREALNNVAFLRARIEFLTAFFTENEVSEIWITFPDPQRKKRQQKKRLTHTNFLKMYQQILQPDSIVHLKTDSIFLHRYTKAILQINKQKIFEQTENLYNSHLYKDALTIKTHYEALFLEGNPTITYLKFQINKQTTLKEPHIKDEVFL